MPERFIFRQVYCGDLQQFLMDGELRAKYHCEPQVCHQTSYREIVDRRGTHTFAMPCGGVVNDYVPFYFSPLTSFTFTISKGNVPLVSPDGVNLGVASDNDRIFFVARTEAFRGSGLDYCFSDYPLNSLAPLPTLESDLSNLAEHVHWDVFDEAPFEASIQEVGYQGVCKYFVNKANPPARMNRSQKRMAEFLVRGAVPLHLIDCIVVKTVLLRDSTQEIMGASDWNIPIYLKRGCYF